MHQHDFGRLQLRNLLNSLSGTDSLHRSGSLGTLFLVKRVRAADEAGCSGSKNRSGERAAACPNPPGLTAFDNEGFGSTKSSAKGR